MRILVTRPEHSAVRTGERLKALGHEPIFLPLFRAEHDPKGVAQARAYKDAAIVLATSAEAIRAMGDAADLAGTPLFAVGASTAEAARSAGFLQAEAAVGDGAALAALLRERFPNETKPGLLYLAGEPRSPRLEQELAAQRFPLKVAVCYRMQPIDLTGETVQAAFQQQPEAVLLYSAETARRFFKLGESFLKETQDINFLCLSPAVAEAVPASLKDRTKFAKRPDERSLFELL